MGTYAYVRLQARDMSLFPFFKTRAMLSGLWNKSRRQGIRVFCYHGVIEQKTSPRLERTLTLLSDFKSHIRFLHQFRILSLDELADGWRSIACSSRGKPTAAITFDDGFANNLLAADVMSALKVPWTLFVPVGAVGQGNCIWTVELSLLLLHGSAEFVEILGRKWPLTTQAEREIAFQGIRWPMKAMPAPRRRETLDQLRLQYPKQETQKLLHEHPSLRSLTWDQIGELASSGVEIASHGVFHEIHHANQPEFVRQFELSEPKVVIERRVMRSCRFWAFPNGDFLPTSACEVQAAGYKLGFTTQLDTVMPTSNPFAMPRLAPSGSLAAFARNYWWEQGQ